MAQRPPPAALAAGDWAEHKGSFDAGFFRDFKTSPEGFQYKCASPAPLTRTRTRTRTHTRALTLTLTVTLTLTLTLALTQVRHGRRG